MNKVNNPFLSPVSFGKDFCQVQPKIPEYLRKNLKDFLDNCNFPSDSDVTTDELYRRYTAMFGGKLNVTEFNCRSFTELLSLMPELIELKHDKASRKVIVLPVRKEAKIDLLSQMLPSSDSSSEKSNLLSHTPPSSDSSSEKSNPLSQMPPSCDSSSEKSNLLSQMLPSFVSSGEEDGSVDKGLEVYITNIRNPNKIYVQFKKSLADLEAFNSMLKSRMNEENFGVEDLKVNKRYALKSEGKWLRVKLIDVKKDEKRCSVFCLDYGLIRECDMKDLRKLPQTMKGESFAIPIRLAGLHSTENKWSKDSVKILKQTLMGATDDLKSSLNCKVDEDERANEGIPIPVWLSTPGGRDLNDEVKRSIIDLENADVVVENADVVAKMEIILGQLKDMELSSEEETFLEKTCLPLEKFLEGKRRSSKTPINGSGSSSPIKQIVFQEKEEETPVLLKEDLKNPSQKKPDIHVQNVESSSRLSLLSVNDWSKVSGIPSRGPEGIDHGIGISFLKKSNRLIVSCMGDKKLKVFSPDGRFIKIVTCVEAEDGDLKEPSDVVSLEDGGFAVSDKSRVLVFDEDGRFVKTAWRTKDFKKCFGLGQDDQKRLALLLDNTRDQTLLCFLDLQKSDNVSCYDVRKVVNGASPQEMGKSKFRFLSVLGNSFIVSDYGLNAVYVLKLSLKGELLKETEIVGGLLKKPAGVSADHEGNILVADYEDNKLCVFSDAGKKIRTIEVCVNCHLKNSYKFLVKVTPRGWSGEDRGKPSTVHLDPDTMELYVLCHRGQEGLVKLVPKLG